jgi:hypothetical protein
MADKQWSDLGEHWQEKHVIKTDGSATIMTRKAGQESEYPHDTSFLDENGETSGLHSSQSKSEHENGIPNPSFWLQDDVYKSLIDNESVEKQHQEDLQKLGDDYQNSLQQSENKTELLTEHINNEQFREQFQALTDEYQNANKETEITTEHIESASSEFEGERENT